MTQITLPNKNVTGDNLWSEVEGNDQAIADTINGDLDNGNLATNADINGSKLLGKSVTASKIADQTITTTQILNGSIVGTTDLYRASVTRDKISSGTLQTIKKGMGSIGGTVTITWPASFNSTDYVVSLTTENLTAAGPPVLYVISRTASSILVRYDGMTTNAWYIHAIGIATS